MRPEAATPPAAPAGTAPGHRTTAQALMRGADEAPSRAKREGRNRVAVGDRAA